MMQLSPNSFLYTTKLYIHRRVTPNQVYKKKKRCNLDNSKVHTQPKPMCHPHKA